MAVLVMSVRVTTALVLTALVLAVLVLTALVLAVLVLTALVLTAPATARGQPCHRALGPGVERPAGRVVADGRG
jgi:hypothetical protein